MRGGMDLVSSPMGIDEGRIIEGHNFEQIFGKNGYRRVDGYERFDGRTVPSQVGYHIIPIDNVVGDIEVDDVVTNAGGSSAEVLLREPGRLIVGTMAGTFSAGEDLLINGVKVAEIDGPVQTPSPAEPSNLHFLRLAQENQRDKITKVPGSGPIRGIHVFKGVTYAFRDAADGLTCGMYKGTGAGWVPVKGGLIPGGKWSFATANFSGDSKRLAFYACDGKNQPFKYDGSVLTFIGAHIVASSTTSNTPAVGDKTLTITEAGRTFSPGQAVFIWSAENVADTMTGAVKSYDDATKALVVTVASHTGSTARTDWCISMQPAGQIYGSQGVSGSSVGVGTGDKTFSVLETLRGWNVGDELTAWSASNPANWMRGTVKSYSGSTVVISVTIFGGSGTANDWMIGDSEYADKPIELVAHKEHLFLAYPGGQLQHSNLGDPMTYTSTAGSFGLGDTITALLQIKGDVMAVFCRSKIHLLYGSSATNWRLDVHSRDAGAISGTAVEVAGAALFVDDRGLVSLQSSQAYGDFESANLSKPVKPLFDKMMMQIVGVKTHKGKNLCRIYFADGSGLNATMIEPSALIDPKYIAFTRFKYSHLPTAFCRGENVDGTEAHYFGTDDGWVMREDSGWNFDGAAITAAFRMPFINLRSPSNKKRFRKLIIEADVARSMTLSFRQLMDYADDNYEPGAVTGGGFYAGGGAFDVDSWDTVLWSAPMVGQAEENIDGVGRNMSLLVWHEDDFMPPFTVQGIALHYSILGVAR